MALDFVAGCIGGCAGVVVGHPLDTIKIRLQTQDANNPKYRGMLDCFKTTLKKEGVRGVYRGLTSPLAGVAGINAIVFGIYNNTQRNLPNSNGLSAHCIAGATAGFCQSFICSPIELAKTRLQVSNTSGGGPLQYLHQIYTLKGIKGVYCGLSITIAREIPSFASYFLSYEILTRRDDDLPVSTLSMLVGGGLAGTISWTVVYPLDVIKSRIQTDGIDGINKYKNSFDCLKKSIQSEGYACLFRGITPTILRAFPVNATTFTVVTWVMRWVQDGDLLWGRYKDAVYSLKVSESAPV